MSTARGWFLWSLAALMVTTEILLTLASSRYVGGLSLGRVTNAFALGVITAIPYLAAAAPSVAYSRRYSASLWVLAMGMLLVATASLFFRYAEISIAADLWSAKLQGLHYGNCGPPARLVILLVDYCGTGLVFGTAGAVFLVQVLWFGGIRIGRVRH